MLRTGKIRPAFPVLDATVPHHIHVIRVDGHPIAELAGYPLQPLEDLLLAHRALLFTKVLRFHWLTQLFICNRCSFASCFLVKECYDLWQAIAWLVLIDINPLAKVHSNPSPIKPHVTIRRAKYHVLMPELC